MSDLKQKPFDIPKRLVWEAYRKVAANKGAAGVDGQSIAEFEEGFSCRNHESRPVSALTAPMVPYESLCCLRPRCRQPPAPDTGCPRTSGRSSLPSFPGWRAARPSCPPFSTSVAGCIWHERCHPVNAAVRALPDG